MPEEKYQPGYSDKWLEFMSKRSGAEQIAHVAQLVEPGMEILDIRCGPGSITIGLAELAAPGQVVGIDMSDAQFGRARSAAIEQGVENIEFRTGNAYELPFDDESFDIVTENAMLMHLQEPGRAIAEMKRVLRPGGYIAVQDMYIDGWTVHSTVPLRVPGGIARLAGIVTETQSRHGADWGVAIKHRGNLNAAGFADVETGASPLVFSGVQGFELAEGASTVLNPIFEEAVELGLMTASELQEYLAWRESLPTDPAAVEIRPWIHATGRKPE